MLTQLEIRPETALGAPNPAPVPEGWDLTGEWYSKVDLLIPNEVELASLCGVSIEDITGKGEEAMARSLLEWGVRVAVIVTLGPRGAMIVRRDRPSETPGVASDALDAGNGIRTIMVEEPADLPCRCPSWMPWAPATPSAGRWPPKLIVSRSQAKAAANDRCRRWMLHAVLENSLVIFIQ